MSEAKGSLYLSVTELTELIKGKLEYDPDLRSVYLKGEISNYKVYPSGHAYFSLKDDGALISCVMWNSYRLNLRFAPKNGDEVLCHGRITVYPSRGLYQFSLDRMELAGAGAELMKLRILAQKLKAEGLFAPERKRKIPSFPRRIGVIMGKGSAGMRDVEVNVAKRWPLAELLEYPSLVQGKDAPKALCAAFKAAQEDQLDVLILGRGGGSSEDLGAFNDETLVRLLATSNCPIISAVGHEVDVTLTDLVADVRVSTPTAAAVAAVPDKNDVYQRLDDAENRLDNQMAAILAEARKELDFLSKRPFFQDPASLYREKRKEIEQDQALIDAKMRSNLALLRLSLDHQSKALEPALAHSFAIKKQQVSAAKDHLEALSPYGVLERGYSITSDEKGNIIDSLSSVNVGQDLVTRVKDGIIVSKVKEKNNG